MALVLKNLFRTPKKKKYRGMRVTRSPWELAVPTLHRRGLRWFALCCRFCVWAWVGCVHFCLWWVLALVVVVAVLRLLPSCVAVRVG
jgi:hypothetical protein